MDAFIHIDYEEHLVLGRKACIPPNTVGPPIRSKPKKLLILLKVIVGFAEKSINYNLNSHQYSFLALIASFHLDTSLLPSKSKKNAKRSNLICRVAVPAPLATFLVVLWAYWTIGPTEAQLIIVFI